MGVLTGAAKASRRAKIAQKLRDRVGKGYMEDLTYKKSLTEGSRQMSKEELARRSSGRKPVFPWLSDQKLRNIIKEDKAAEAKYQSLIKQGVTNQIALKEVAKSIGRGALMTAAAGGAGAAFLGGMTAATQKKNN